MSGSENNNLEVEIKSYNDSVATYNAAKVILNEKQQLFLIAVAAGNTMDEKAVEAARTALLGAYKNFNPAKKAVEEAWKPLGAELAALALDFNNGEFNRINDQLEDPSTVTPALVKKLPRTWGFAILMAPVVFFNWLFRASSFATTLWLGANPSSDVDQQIETLAQNNNPQEIRRGLQFLFRASSANTQGELRVLGMEGRNALAVPAEAHARVSSESLSSTKAAESTGIAAGSKKTDLAVIPEANSASPTLK